MPQQYAKTKPPRSVGASALVAAGILLSRIAGLIRERVFAHYFGNSLPAAAFRAAVRIPNFLQTLCGEGVLSASFIPVYSRLLSEGRRDVAGKVAGVVASLLALLVSVVVLLGVLLTPALVDIVAPGFHGELRTLTAHLVQILFPGAGIFVMSAWCLGILNSHRLFFISYVAPVCWNLAMIVTLLAFGHKQPPDSLAVTLAWGSVVGAALQLGVQLPFIYGKRKGAPSIGADIRFALDTTLQPVRQVFRSLGPVVISRGVVQLSAFVDAMVASYLGAIAVSSLGYVQTIYTLPISLFGMSVAAAELPAMSSSTGSQDEIFSKLRSRLISGQRTIAFYVIPTVAGFLLLGRFIVAALYQSGHFGPEDTLYIWYVLMGSTVGLLAASWGRLYSSAFYALGDTRTPLRFAIIRVTLTAGLGILFAFPLRPFLTSCLLNVLQLPEPSLPGIEQGLGAVGLTFSAGIAGWVEFLLLRRALGSKIGSTALPKEYPLIIWTAALLASLAAWAVGRWIHLRHPWLGLAEVLSVFGIIYFAFTITLGIPEARALTRRFR